MKTLRCLSHLAIGLSALIFATSCSLIFGTGGEADNKSHDYKIERLDRMPGWQMLTGPEFDVAFENRQTGAIVSLNTVCKEDRGHTLEELSDQLLLGMKFKTAPQRNQITVDGAKALETTVDVSGDTEVRIRSVVLKKQACTYDLMFVSRPKYFKQKLPDFEKFVRGFHAD